MLIADPPAINTKTLECYATSIRLLAGPSAKILFSTMENFDTTMYDLLGLSPKPFKPDLPGFGLDGRWSFYTNFGCDRLSERNPEAEARAAAAAEETDAEAEDFCSGFHQPQHEI